MSANPKGAKLSPRQQQVSDLMLTGASFKEIAQRVGVAHGSVQIYATEVYSRLGVSGRVELMARRIAELESR